MLMYKNCLFEKTVKMVFHMENNTTNTKFYAYFLSQQHIQHNNII